MELLTRNVNTAFETLVKLFTTREYGGDFDYRRHGDKAPIVSEPSRNGKVLRIQGPVTITYTHPLERVLFNSARDCNPFSLLYEALWMLAGRNDVAPLVYYTKNFANYSDDGKTLNGAYGHRWRHAQVPDEMNYDRYATDDEPRQTWTNVDQLDIIVNHLKADPISRRPVLQMWNVEDDLLKIGQPCATCMGTGRLLYDETRTDNSKTGFKLDYEADAPTCSACGGKLLTNTSKDVCCNLCVMFSIRDDLEYNESPVSTEYRFIPKKVLDITVINRSNDLVWGLLNANYVTFSVLQEYMASRIGVEVGLYHHISNNLHAYDFNFEPEKWLKVYEGNEPIDRYGKDNVLDVTNETNKTWRANEPFKHIRLVHNTEVFEKELPHFVQINSFNNNVANAVHWDEPFFAKVAQPMLAAFHAYKAFESKTAVQWASRIAAADWRFAALEWLQRRKNKASANACKNNT